MTLGLGNTQVHICTAAAGVGEVRRSSEEATSETRTGPLGTEGQEERPMRKSQVEKEKKKERKKVFTLTFFLRFI